MAVALQQAALRALLLLLARLGGVCAQPEDAVHLRLGRRPAEHLRSMAHGSDLELKP